MNIDEVAGKTRSLAVTPRSGRHAGAFVGLAILVAAAGAASFPPPAFAQRDVNRRPEVHRPPEARRPPEAHRPPAWRGNIARFHEHDWAVWRNGRWVHRAHGGRWGWWWVVGNSWYFYPVPVYPYPSPWEPAPVVLASPPEVPPTQYWYLCEASQTYYPYVATCPGGWKQVPAVPADAAGPPPSK